MPGNILAETPRILRSLSGGVRESVVLWVGVEATDEALVRRIVVPRQRSTAKRFDVPLRERHRIIQELAGSGDKLLVQLHTHPRSAFHSCADDRLALPRHIGALSVVIADFASNWDGDLQQASVNRHLGGGVWSELSPETVSTLFEER